MQITNDLLASVFADSSLFCGKEDVIHAILYHRLKASGVSPLRIAREQALSGNRIDIVVFGEGVRGDFAATTGRPLACIEVKGGAYGDRNALTDQIDAAGYCSDMAKLKPEADKGAECWFLCIDMPELGRAISPLKVGRVAERCMAHGLSFAYHCQGEGRFYVARPRQKLAQIPIVNSVATTRKAATDFLLDPKASPLAALAGHCLAVSGHEANATALLYDCLRNAGFGPAQLSLETYFSFAAKAGSRMQERPDLVVFDHEFDGRFNLYRGGDRRQSNDTHKLAHIDTIFEVKGGAAMDRKGDKAVMQAYLGDVRKLARWRDNAHAMRPGTRVRTVFLGVDGRKRGLPAASVATLLNESRRLGSGLLYISRDRIESVRA